MKISRVLPLVCAGVLCAGVSAFAADNAAQAAARAALLQALNSNSPPAESGTADNNQAPLPDNQAAAPAPEETQPAPSANPTPSPTEQPANSASGNFSTPPPPSQNSDVEAEERAIIAAEMKQDANAQPANPSQKPAEQKPGLFSRWFHHSQQNPPKQPVVAETKPVEPVAPAPQANVNSAAQNQPVTPIATPAPVASPTPPVQTPPPAAAQKPGFFSRFFNRFHRNQSAVVEVNSPKPEKKNRQNEGFAPIQPPPPPVSQEKDAELHTLLQQYEANQITPEQYQTRRAEILNSP